MAADGRLTVELARLSAMMRHEGLPGFPTKRCEEHREGTVRVLERNFDAFMAMFDLPDGVIDVVRTTGALEPCHRWMLDRKIANPVEPSRC